jgi:hypothetical protein
MSKNKTGARIGKVDTTNPVEKFTMRKFTSMKVINIINTDTVAGEKVTFHN